MTIGESLLYIIMLVSWVFGVAVTKTTGMMLLAIFVPPAAWVILAMEVLK